MQRSLPSFDLITSINQNLTHRAITILFLCVCKCHTSTQNSIPVFYRLRFSSSPPFILCGVWCVVMLVREWGTRGSTTAPPAGCQTARERLLPLARTTNCFLFTGVLVYLFRLPRRATIIFRRGFVFSRCHHPCMVILALNLPFL